MDKLESISSVAMEKVESLTKYMLPAANDASSSNTMETTCDATKDKINK